MACKRTVPGDLPLCIQCGEPLQGPGRLPAVPVKAAATVVPPKPPVVKAAGPDPEKLRIEAKSRVMWGEERRAIRSDLVRQGYAAREVDRALDDAVRERLAHFRSTGIRDIVVGAACLAVFAVLFGFMFLSRSGRLVLGKGAFALFGLPPAGLYFLIRGISRVLGGGKGEGSATDLEEGD